VDPGRDDFGWLIGHPGNGVLRMEVLCHTAKACDNDKSGSGVQNNRLGARRVAGVGRTWMPG